MPFKETVGDQIVYECKDEVLSISSVVKDSTYRGQ